MIFFIENRQAFKNKLLILFLATFCLSLQSCAQKETKTQQTTKEEAKPDYSKVDYSARSNIIKRPKELTGDEKAIFYHPYFLKLTSDEAKNLEPLEIKAEFAKLEIETKERDRFVKAYSFFRIKYWGHKVSCEQWESFKELAPQSKN